MAFDPGTCVVIFSSPEFATSFPVARWNHTGLITDCGPAGAPVPDK